MFTELTETYKNADNYENSYRESAERAMRSRRRCKLGQFNVYKQGKMEEGVD